MNVKSTIQLSIFLILIIFLTYIIKTTFLSDREEIVNLDVIDKLGIDLINVDTLIEYGIIKKASCPVKILGNGEVSKSIKLTADMFSQTAIKKIEAAGGEVIYDK